MPAGSLYRERIPQIVLGLKRLVSRLSETRHGCEVADRAVDSAIPCVRCGLCCTDLVVKLTTDDIRALARGLGVSNHDAIRSYVRVTSIGLALRQIGSRCIFLEGWGDGQTACAIYPFRPEACRRWVPGLSVVECREGVAPWGPTQR